MNKILLNNKEYHVKESDLPYLIIYKEKSGGSHFTITLLVDLFSSGSKIVFFTAFPMAKDNFLEQVGSNNSKIAFVNSVEDLENNKNSQIIILNSGDESLFIGTINILEDINERVVLIKNIESFNQNVFLNCLELEKIILSGDIDNCVAKDQILNKHFNSIIAFNKPQITIPIEIPILEKWSGYLSSESSKGVIKVQVN